MSKYGYPGTVVVSIDAHPECGDMPTFDIKQFMSNCEYSTVVEPYPHQYNITGPFDDLWQGWVNHCDDEPNEFMARVIKGHENCPPIND